MKKLLIAMAALMTLAFVGCEKEEETATDALTGTTWESSYEGIPLSVSFSAGGIVTLSMGSETYTGTYVYSNSNVTIQIPIDGRNETFTGTYSNGSLYIAGDLGSFVFTQTGGPSPDESGDDSESDDSIQGPAAGVKLVKQIKITEQGETDVMEFEYDAQNRVSKIAFNYGDEDVYSFTFSYSGNKLVIRNDKDGSKESEIQISDGYIKSIDSSVFFEYDNNGYMTQLRDNYGNDTYTWSNGNLTSIASKYDDYTQTITITYNESMVLVPTNMHLLHLFAIYTYEDDLWLTAYEVWGKQCKNLPEKLEVNDNDGYSATFAFDYEFNNDGSIAKMVMTNNKTVNMLEFIYY